MSALQAVIYDMDGILIDSEPFWEASEIAAFAQVGMHMTHDDYLQVMGMRTDAVVHYWFERHPWNLATATLADVVAWIERGVIERITEGGELLGGVLQSLSFFQNRGCRIALASSSSFAIIDHVLTVMNLGSFFEIAHSAQGEVNGKPHPDVYLSTLQLLGVIAEETIAIEDSRNGITAAVAAGMRCIGIPDPHTADKSVFDHANVVIPSLSDINESLLAELGF